MPLHYGTSALIDGQVYRWTNGEGFSTPPPTRASHIVAFSTTGTLATLVQRAAGKHEHSDYDQSFHTNTFLCSGAAAPQ